jgi:hypothetical protein
MLSLHRELYVGCYLSISHISGFSESWHSVRLSDNSPSTDTKFSNEKLIESSIGITYVPCGKRSGLVLLNGDGKVFNERAYLFVRKAPILKKAINVTKKPIRKQASRQLAHLRFIQ